MESDSDIIYVNEPRKTSALTAASFFKSAKELQVIGTDMNQYPPCERDSKHRWRIRDDGVQLLSICSLKYLHITKVPFIRAAAMIIS